MTEQPKKLKKPVAVQIHWNTVGKFWGAYEPSNGVPTGPTGVIVPAAMWTAIRKRLRKHGEKVEGLE